MKTSFLTAFAAVAALSTGAAFADSISPESLTLSLDVGESYTFTKTVTVNAGTPTSAKLDVFFLADTTGSMGGQINSAKANAGTILSGLTGLGDVHFGVGEYRDYFDSFAYRTNTPLTDISNTATIQAGINAWSASGGGDFPEANIYALDQVAKNTGWRDDSTRVVVMFGDAPGHVGNSSDHPMGFYPTEAAAIASLNDKGITVHIGNTGGTGNSGMNAPVDGDGGGQANRIAAATGGSVFTLGSSGAGIADLILAAVESTFATYNSVSLGVPTLDGLDITFTPLFSTPAEGWTREEDRAFDFEVTFTATKAGVYDFTIGGLVNGGLVASEHDIVTVGDIAPIPLPAAMPLYLAALGGAGLWHRRRRNKRG